MDTNSIDSAQKIWKWDMNGLGYSKNGINGPWGVAITMNGQISADYILTGELDASLIKVGKIQDVKNKNFWNMETGEFSLSATATVGGKTVAKIAEDAVDAQTQSDIFNKLTNNGQTQGIYLSGGKVYINATYIATGTLADSGKNTTFDLSTGTLTMKKGSINIGNGTFKVTTSGALTATSADIEGTVKCGFSSGYWVKMNNSGEITGGYGSSQYGYIDYSGSCVDINNGNTYKGIQIQGGCLRISTRVIMVARSTSTGTTTTEGGNGTMNFISKIQNNGDGTITWWNSSVSFINGIMTSQL